MKLFWCYLKFFKCMTKITEIWKTNNVCKLLNLTFSFSSYCNFERFKKKKESFCLGILQVMNFCRKNFKIFLRKSFIEIFRIQSIFGRCIKIKTNLISTFRYFYHSTGNLKLLDISITLNSVVEYWTCTQNTLLILMLNWINYHCLLQK